MGLEQQRSCTTLQRSGSAANRSVIELKLHTRRYLIYQFVGKSKSWVFTKKSEKILLAIEMKDSSGVVTLTYNIRKT